MSSALVKISASDSLGNYLLLKVTSSDATVSFTETIVAGVSVLDIKAPGGGAPAGITLGTVTTAVDYTLVPAAKTVVLVSNTAAVIHLPAAAGFQEAVEYLIKDIAGTAGTTNLSIVCDQAGDEFEGGLTEILITEDYDCIKFMTNGSNRFYLTTPHI